MAKKRGGIAGFYDRNKGVIKTVAPIAAGFIPGIGPMLGAGIGAAMGGLDREGKSGIGLDVGGALKGGISGYGGAKLGQAAKGGLAKMFTGGSPIDKLTGAPKMGLTPGGPTSYGKIGSYKLPRYQQSIPTALNLPDDANQVVEGGKGLGSLFGKEGIIEQNKTLFSGVGKGIMGIRKDDLDQQAADATMAQRKYEFDKTYGLDAAQEADRKRREDQLQAQRAAFRAMFTGTA